MRVDISRAGMRSAIAKLSERLSIAAICGIVAVVLYHAELAPIAGMAPRVPIEVLRTKPVPLQLPSRRPEATGRETN